jgi:hypothetical protein
MAVATAVTRCPSLVGRRISPHTLRHYLPLPTMSSDVREPSRSIGNVRSQRIKAQPIARHSLVGPTDC